MKLRDKLEFSHRVKPYCELRRPPPANKINAVINCQLAVSALVVGQGNFQARDKSSRRFC